MHHLDIPAKLLGGYAVAFISNRELVLHTDNTFKHYNVVTGVSTPCIPEGMQCLTVSANGEIAILLPKQKSYTDGPLIATDALIVWDIPSHKEVAQIPTTSGSKFQILTSPDGKLFALQDSTSPDLIKIWKITASGLSKTSITLDQNMEISFGGEGGIASYSTLSFRGGSF